MKNFNDTIGNRARDLLACSAVPQPTAPLRAPHYDCYKMLFRFPLNLLVICSPLLLVSDGVTVRLAPDFHALF
jgi:hypothetical protein